MSSCECCPCSDKQQLCCLSLPKMGCFVGHPAPMFDTDALMPNGTFSRVTLNSYKGKYLVLFFYPLDFTFVCPTEIIAFSERIKEFQDINCEVVAASCDSVYSHLAWTHVPRSEGGLGKMNIPILADKNCDIAKAYNICIENQGISLRGLFIIDPKGILRQIIVNDLPVGRSVDETLRLVEAYKFTDTHGEVCPINWKKGDKTLNPNKSSEFFSHEYK